MKQTKQQRISELELENSKLRKENHDLNDELIQKNAELHKYKVFVEKLKIKTSVLHECSRELVKEVNDEQNYRPMFDFRKLGGWPR